MPEQAERQLDEVVAGAGAFEQGAEQHEEKHEAGGHAEGDAEHPLGGDPLVVGQRGEAHPAVRQQGRHPRAGDAVDQEQQGDHRQRRAERAAGGLQQQRDADAGGDQVEGGQVAGALGQLLVGDEQVGGAGAGDQAEGDVGERHAVARRALERRIGEEGQQQGEGQVDRAGLGVVEHAEAEHERQRRGDPQLEQRPGQGQAGDHRGHRAHGQAAAHVLGDQFLGGELLVMHGMNLHRKTDNARTRGLAARGFWEEAA
ncbi:hypothetical protein D3C86_1438840 [compost metagenome]